MQRIEIDHDYTNSNAEISAVVTALSVLIAGCEDRRERWIKAPGEILVSDLRKQHLTILRAARALAVFMEDVP